jgi:tRNA G18 (ribose-2'-O)-methylase SpoU
VPILELTDPGDPRIADYHGVRDPDLVRQGGIFIAEGRQVVGQLMAGRRFPVRSVLLTETAREALADVLATRPEVPVFVVPSPLVRELAGFHIHQGCLAIGTRRPARSWHEVASPATHLLALEAVGNPDNIGGLFRNARAFGTGGVLLGPGCADPLYRKAIRTSMGAALEVPFATVAEWPQALTALRSDGWAVVAATPSGGALPVRQAAARLENRRVVVVLGHEGTGLSAEALKVCEIRARVPMTAGVDSLNVAAAAAVILYEFGRDV